MNHAKITNWMNLNRLVKKLFYTVCVFIVCVCVYIYIYFFFNLLLKENKKDHAISTRNAVIIYFILLYKIFFVQYEIFYIIEFHLFTYIFNV